MLTTPGATPRGATKAVFRPDIEGMRAIAVLLVMVFHAGFPLVSGGYVGVDVFFVISGFLITGLLVREVERSGRVDYRRFYARRIKRLLPAGTVVLVFVSFGSWLWQPAGAWSGVAGELIAATLFVVNWVFAAEATDYFADDGSESPVQHFWSLSVEEQFYLVWPTLLVLFAGWKLLQRWRFRQRLLIAMGLVLIPSLGWSIYLTSVDEGRAYFVTTTRLWELALGGVVALTLPRWRRLPDLILSSLAWVGLAMIAASALILTTESPFPGYRAMLPTLGAALVIGACSGDSNLGPKGLLSSAPMVWIGGLSYSLYLWHWPFAVFAPYVFPGGGQWVVAVAVVMSVLPAWLSFRFLEDPIRRSAALNSSVGWALTIGVLCLCIGLVAALGLRSAGLQARVDSLQGQPTDVESADFPGAAVMFDEEYLEANPGPVAQAEPILPDPEFAGDDLGEFHDRDCLAGYAQVDVTTCAAGDPDNPIRLALVGDSHVGHWFIPMKALAERGDFYLEAYAKAACPFAETEMRRPGTEAVYEECVEWVDNLQEFLLDDPPDYVVGVASDQSLAIAGGELAGKADSGRLKGEGLAQVYRTLEDAGIPVAHISTIPVMQPIGDPPECVSLHRDDLTACALVRDEALPATGYQQVLEDSLQGLSVIDLTDAFCLPQDCPSVIGNMMVYRDWSHLTATYAATLTPYLADELGEVISE